MLWLRSLNTILSKAAIQRLIGHIAVGQLLLKYTSVRPSPGCKSASSVGHRKSLRYRQISIFTSGITYPCVILCSKDTKTEKIEPLWNLRMYSFKKIHFLSASTVLFSAWTLLRFLSIDPTISTKMLSTKNISGGLLFLWPFGKSMVEVAGHLKCERGSRLQMFYSRPTSNNCLSEERITVGNKAPLDVFVVHLRGSKWQTFCSSPKSGHGFPWFSNNNHVCAPQVWQREYPVTLWRAIQGTRERAVNPTRSTSNGKSSISTTPTQGTSP